MMKPRIYFQILNGFLIMRDDAVALPQRTEHTESNRTVLQSGYGLVEMVSFHIRNDKKKIRFYPRAALSHEILTSVWLQIQATFMDSSFAEASPDESVRPALRVMRGRGAACMRV